MAQTSRQQPYRVCFVCTGNICRSPTAEAVLRTQAAEQGLDDRLLVDSAGLGDWHVGHDADPRSLATLRAAGYDLRHRARQFQAAWFATRDLVVALDSGHLAALRDLAPDQEARDRVVLLRSFDAAADAADIADPYFDGPEGFRRVLADVEPACAGLLGHIQAQLSRRRAADG